MIKILMISADAKILEEGTPVRARMAEYGRLFQELHIIVFFKKDSSKNSEEKIKISSNTFVYPTYSSSKLFYVTDAMRKAVSIIRAEKLSKNDTVITTQDPFETGLVGKKISKKFGIPLHIQIHTDFQNPYFKKNLLNKVRLRLAKKNLPYAQAIRAVSERIRDGLSNDIKLKTSVLPIFIDLDLLKTAPIGVDLHKKYPQFEKIVLIASRLTEEKNISSAIMAFTIASESMPKVGLIIVGEGNKKAALESQVKNLRLGDKIFFEPWADHDTLNSYMKTCDVFVSSSLYEGYGLSMLEAHAVGTKLVLTDVGIAPLLVEKENLSKPQDVKALSAVLKKALLSGIENKPYVYPYASKNSYLEAYKVDLERVRHSPRLLVFTQALDRLDPTLSAYHRLVAEIAKNFVSMTVVCLKKGQVDLPKNVKILSLGKEGGASRLKYVWRFYKYIFSENYDAVFVHMNQEYILLGGIFWKLMGKRVYMWRNHHAGSFLTDVAASFCTKVFCTSKFSYTAKYQKTVLMPVGVDTQVFKKISEVVKKPRSVLFLARIAPVKKPHVLIHALALLQKKGVDFTASFYGDPLPSDKKYHQSLQKMVEANKLEAKVFFHAGIANDKTPETYNAHEVFVNLSSSGMYDKTIFEAMACETLTVATNRNLEGLIDPMFVAREDDPQDIAGKIEHVLNLPNQVKLQKALHLREITEKHHSLRALGQKLAKEIS